MESVSTRPHSFHLYFHRTRTPDPNTLYNVATHAGMLCGTADLTFINGTERVRNWSLSSAAGSGTCRWLGDFLQIH